MEDRCYRRARRIVVVTRGIRTRLMMRGLPPEKVVFIPNGANIELFQPDPEARQALRVQLGMENRFLVLYAGIHGVAQGLETVLEAAQRLTGDPEVHFLFVGEGPCKPDLLKRKEEMHLSNVTMLAGQPRECIPAFLSAADVGLIPLRRLDVFEGALPSKMFDAWACGLPVILGVKGEAKEVLEQAGAGLAVEPEDPSQLCQAILRLKADPQLREDYGRKGRDFVMRNYDRRDLAERLERVLREVGGKGS
jgi:glycosyltransferase involved in cell wall biosynthesis